MEGQCRGDLWPLQRLSRHAPMLPARSATRSASAWPARFGRPMAITRTPAGPTPGQFDGHGLGLKQESVRAKIKFELSRDFPRDAGLQLTRAPTIRAASSSRRSKTSPPAILRAQAATRGRRSLGEVAGDVFDLDFKQHEGSLKLELDTGIGTLRSVTGYAKATLPTTVRFRRQLCARQLSRRR